MVIMHIKMMITPVKNAYRKTVGKVIMHLKMMITAVKNGYNDCKKEVGSVGGRVRFYHRAQP